MTGKNDLVNAIVYLYILNANVVRHGLDSYKRIFFVLKRRKCEGVSEF